MTQKGGAKPREAKKYFELVAFELCEFELLGSTVHCFPEVDFPFYIIILTFCQVVLALGLLCFVAGTYTVLTSQESGGDHVIDTHPAGFDPIKPVDFNSIPQKANQTVVRLNIAPQDVAKVSSFHLSVCSGHCKINFPFCFISG